MKIKYLIPVAALLICSCTSLKVKMFEKITGGTVEMKASRVEVPFRCNGNHIYIDVKINNSTEPLSFIFDTGAITIIDTSLIRSLNLKNMQSEEADSSNKKARKTFVLTADSVILHNQLKINEVSLFATSLKKNYQNAGIVGPNLIRELKTSIDYKKNLLTFESGTANLQSNSRSETVVDMDIILPYRATVDIDFGDFCLPGEIDTGSPFAFVLPLKYLDELDDQQKKGLIKAKGFFMINPRAVPEVNYLYKFDEIKIGSITLTDQPVIFGNFGDDSYGLVGKLFLENYITQLDFNNRQIKFTNNQSSDSSSVSYLFSTGLKLAKKDNKIVVAAVWENSPADLAGIDCNDEILSINNLPASECLPENLYQFMYSTQIRELELTMSKNGQKIIVRKVNLL